MRLARYCVVDISTAPIDGCEQWIDIGDPPGNYTKADTIADWREKKRAELIERAALDPDLARITGLAIRTHDERASDLCLCRTEAEEHMALSWFIDVWNERSLIGFNSLRFDWPMLMRRARYLGLNLTINTDRFKTNHSDLSDVLTHRGALTAKSLDFYVRRHGWTDLWPKPLSGADEAQVPVTGRWSELADSLKRDVEATYRLAVWAGVIQPVPAMSAEQLEVGF